MLDGQYKAVVADGHDEDWRYGLALRWHRMELPLTMARKKYVVVVAANGGSSGPTVAVQR